MSKVNVYNKQTGKPFETSKEDAELLIATGKFTKEDPNKKPVKAEK